MKKSNELSFEEERKKLSHLAQNESPLLVRLTPEQIEQIDYLYEPILMQIKDEVARKKAEYEIKFTISKIVRASNHREKLHETVPLPSKEKRNQKQDKVIKAIGIVLDSLNTKANEAYYDLEGSGAKQEFFESDPSAIDIINYIKFLKAHQIQIEKLKKGEIQCDLIFNSKDYLKKQQVFKTPLKKLLDNLIHEYGIEISPKNLEETLQNTPPILPAKDTKSTKDLPKKSN